MDIIKNLEFDGYCKKNAALIGFFAAVRILTSLCGGSGLLFAAECFGALVGELSACAMITLYFAVLTHALSAAAEKSSRLYALAEALSAALKLCFVLEPLSPCGENALVVKFSALLLDAFLTRLYPPENPAASAETVRDP